MKNLWFTSLKLLSILFAIVYFSSCSEDSLDYSETANDAPEKVSVRTDFDYNHPLEVGDVYLFTDSTHFVTHYDALSLLYSADLDSFNTEVSLGRTIPTVYNLIENDEFVNPQDAYKPFLTDPIIQSFANEHFEFRIGNALVTYINNKQILVSDHADNSVKTSIRNLPKGNIITVDQVPAGAFWGEDSYNESFFGSNCGCKLYVEQVCNNQIRIHGSCSNLVWGEGEGEFSVWFHADPFDLQQRFGIPVRDPDIEFDVDGNFEFFVDINNIDYFYILIDPECVFGSNKSEEIEIIDNFQECDRGERSSGWLFATDGWYQGYSYIVSNHRNRNKNFSEVKMHSKKLINGVWRKHYGNLSLTLTENRKEPTPDCSLINTGSLTKSCNNCDAVGLRFEYLSSDPIHHCDDDVIGDFTKVMNWNNSTWSIDRTHSVDYDCCN